MSMKLTTALNKRNIARDRLRSLAAMAEGCGLHQASIIQHEAKIRTQLKGTPQWVQSYCQGVWDTLLEAMYRKQVNLRVLSDGRVVSVHRDLPDYYEKVGLSPRECHQLTVATGIAWICPWHKLSDEKGPPGYRWYWGPTPVNSL